MFNVDESLKEAQAILKKKKDDWKEVVSMEDKRFIEAMKDIPFIDFKKNEQGQYTEAAYYMFAAWMIRDKDEYIRNKCTTTKEIRALLQNT